MTTFNLLTRIMDRDGVLGQENAPREWVELCRDLQAEITRLRVSVAHTENAMELRSSEGLVTRDFMKTEKIKWRAVTYQSGTQAVLPDHPSPYFHIGHLAADNDGHHGRSDVAKELETWLNGGADPWWRSLLSRTCPRSVTTPHGCCIQATGPMIDEAKPPSWGIWKEDDSADAQIERGLLIESLLKT